MIRAGSLEEIKEKLPIRELAVTLGCPGKNPEGLSVKE
jgi:hypothetical protein